MDTRVYSERYTRIMWKRNPFMMANKAHCYPCCDVPTNKKCTGCQYPAPCLLRRKYGRVHPSKVCVVDGRNRRADDFYLSLLYGLAGSELTMWPLPYQRPYLDAIGGRRKKKPQSQCHLPGCQNTTNHRGGYCCPEHSREHHKIQGRKVKAIGR